MSIDKPNPHQREDKLSEKERTEQERNWEEALADSINQLVIDQEKLELGKTMYGRPVKKKRYPSLRSEILASQMISVTRLEDGDLEIDIDDTSFKVGKDGVEIIREPIYSRADFDDPHVIMINDHDLPDLIKAVDTCDKS